MVSRFAGSSADNLRPFLAAALVGAFVVPPTWLERGPVLCVFRRLTGHRCPACGLTRSWSAFAHGRFRDGYQHHVFGGPALLLAIALIVLSRGPERAELPTSNPAF